MTNLLLFLPLLLVMVSGTSFADLLSTDSQLCWKTTYGRGVGTIPTTCPADKPHKDAGLCYPYCPDNLKAVGPLCWQRNCPEGFRDDGAFCAKPKPYGRGAGYALWDKGKCNSKNPQGCEKWGALYYPKCKPGFKNVGCCVCSPICPGGMKDIGVSCAKVTKGRGVGKIPDCGSDKVKDAGLCYKACREGYNQVGPVCWGKCPPEYPVNCGAACAVSQNDCAEGIIDQVTSVINVVANIGDAVVTGGTATQAAKAAGAGAKAAAMAALKAVAKNLGKKLVNATKQQVKDLIVEEFKKSGKNFPKNAVAKMAEMISDPEKALEAIDLGTIDPTGVFAVVKAYNKPICGKVKPRDMGEGDQDGPRIPLPPPITPIEPKPEPPVVVIEEPKEPVIIKKPKPAYKQPKKAYRKKSRAASGASKLKYVKPTKKSKAKKTKKTKKTKTTDPSKKFTKQ